jgi:hypothetical protein
MKRAFPFRLSLPIVFALAALAGCSRGTGTDTTGNPPSSSATPAAISSSAQVVKVTSAPISIASNGSADAVITLSISPGFHINANPATFSYLIATELQPIPSPDNPIETGTPVYPSPVKKKFVFAEQPLAVYEGDVTIRLPLHFASAGKSYVRVTSGAHLSQPITLRVQACDNEKCFPPATVDTTIPVEVK